MKVLLIGLISLFLGLQFALWAGDKSVFDLLHLRQQLADTQAENQAMLQRNDQLAGEVLELKSGGEAVESIARQELGFIKEGETFYQVVKPKQ